MEDIVCSGCSLLCDDASVDFKDKSVNSLGLCRLGHAHFEDLLSHSSTPAIVRENGAEKEVSLEEAVLHAVKLFRNGPTLLFGWSNASNEAVATGLKLAVELKGYFDSISSMGLAYAMGHELHNLQLQHDFEYVRNYGELVIYWGSDPTESLHRHPSRFGALPRGEKIPEGFESRTIGVVDVRQSASMKIANHRFIIPIGTDAELLDVLTGELSGTSQVTGAVLGVPAAEILGLIRAIKKADCTAIFYGSGLLNSGNAQKNLDALAKFINAIRSIGKEAFAFPMSPLSNVMGIIQAVAETTSQVTPIDFSSGTPLPDQDSTALKKLLAGEFNSVLVVGDDPFMRIPGPAAKALAKTKFVYIGTPETIADKFAFVSIYASDPMLMTGDSMLRLDMVKTEFKGAVKTSHPSLNAILSRILEEVKKGGV